MTAVVDVLLCGDSEGIARFEQLCRHAPGLQVVRTARSGGEAVAVFRQQRFDLVAIAGDLDGVGGVRVAGALHRERSVPTVLLADASQAERVRLHLSSRGLEEATVISVQHVDEDVVAAARALRAAAQPRATPPGVRVLSRRTDPLKARAELEPIRSAECDVVLLLGSAGTPHMLPQWLPGGGDRVTPLIVAVHHNPKLSVSFCDWVGELLGRSVGRPEIVDGELELSMFNVVPATEDPESDRLMPDLSAVVDRLLDVGLVPLLCIGSGMAFDAVDAIRRSTLAGGVVVALNPVQCTVPTMPESVIASGLAHYVVDVGEMAWVIHRGASLEGCRLAVTG